MAYTFCAIDFETADSQPDSACQVGLVRVEGTEVVRRETRLIRPPREAFIWSHLHGIDWSAVKDQPPFADVWPSIVSILDGAAELVAHNAAFDRKVLVACCAAAGLTPPSIPWVCTLELSRRRWARGNKLNEVCAKLGITLTAHHEAGADAEAAARVLLALRAPADLAKVAAVDPNTPEPGRAFWWFSSDVWGDIRPGLPIEAKPGTRLPVAADWWCYPGDGAWRKVVRAGPKPSPPVRKVAAPVTRPDEEGAIGLWSSDPDQSPNCP